MRSIPTLPCPTPRSDGETISSVSSHSDYTSESEIDGFTFVNPQVGSHFWDSPTAHLSDIPGKYSIPTRVDPLVAVY